MQYDIGYDPFIISHMAELPSLTVKYCFTKRVKLKSQHLNWAQEL